MSTYSIATSPVPGPKRKGKVVHITPVTKVYFYPSVRGTEKRNEVEVIAKGVTKIKPHTYGFGTIFVVVGSTIVKEYEARGGPKETFKGEDLHIHSSIPPGDYPLGPAVQYTTPHWMNSCIPWGAQIRRAASGEIEYNPGSGWLLATGSVKAPMNNAVRSAVIRASGHLTPAQEAQVNDFSKLQFDENPDKPTGRLVTTWQRNDFGAWAFALLQDGKKSGFFIHTTPDDELTPAGTPVKLEPSHGCIHMRPVDRNEAKTNGYLKKGVILHVRAFDAKGKPV